MSSPDSVKVRVRKTPSSPWEEGTLSYWDIDLTLSIDGKRLPFSKAAPLEVRLPWEGVPVWTPRPAVAPHDRGTIERWWWLCMLGVADGEGDSAWQRSVLLALPKPRYVHPSEDALLRREAEDRRGELK